ncbi:MAG TPA: hypothetical protein VGO73_02070 [Pyrinomonadaceae bacterium]|nr:hypothetical protein [Pyrinomonadaceae bacterium]
MAQIFATSPPTKYLGPTIGSHILVDFKMAENVASEQEGSRQSSLEQRFDRAARWAGVLSIPLLFLTLGLAVSWTIRIVLSIVTVLLIGIYFYAERRPIRRLARRLNAMFSGASKWDVAFDLFRISGILLILCVPFTLLGTQIVFSLAGKLFVIGIALVFAHPVYRFFRKPGLWDHEYKLRKSMFATAVNYAAASLEDTNYSTYINRIEINALLTIKSYLEYSVTDRDKGNFNANLIVKDPTNPQQLICVQRSNPGKVVPKYYDVSTMQNAVKALETGKPRYLSRFRSKYGKPYRMVWLIPISDREEGREVIGLLAIDSLRPGHLDLEDGRESLIFNLLPYVAVLRYTLTLRRLHSVWN